MARFYVIHAYNLRPEFSGRQFERFMEDEWLPYVMQRPGCLGTMLLKGYAGEWTNVKFDYATIEIWESVKASRAAWGGARREWVTPDEIRPFMDRFRAYAIPESFRTYEFELVI